MDEVAEAIGDLALTGIECADSVGAVAGERDERVELEPFLQETGLQFGELGVASLGAFAFREPHPAHEAGGTELGEEGGEGDDVGGGVEHGSAFREKGQRGKGVKGLRARKKWRSGKVAELENSEAAECGGV